MYQRSSPEGAFGWISRRQSPFVLARPDEAHQCAKRLLRCLCGFGVLAFGDRRVKHHGKVLWLAQSEGDVLVCHSNCCCKFPEPDPKIGVTQKSSELVLSLAAGQLPASPSNRKRAITSRLPDSSASCRNGFPFISLPWRSVGKRSRNRATHLASPSSMA